MTDSEKFNIELMTVSYFVLQIDEAVHHDQLVMLEKLYNAFTKVDLAAGNQVIDAVHLLCVTFLFAIPYMQLVEDTVEKLPCFFLALALSIVTRKWGPPVQNQDSPCTFHTFRVDLLRRIQRYFKPFPANKRISS